MTRGTRTILTAASALTLLLSAGSEARASLIGLDVTVTFVEPTFTDVIDMVTVAPGHEITEGDGTNIGGSPGDPGIFLEGEFIDIGAASIVYRVRGDGDDHPLDSAYQLTGFDPLAQYIFDFDLGVSGDHIVSVMVLLDGVIGVAAPGQVQFTDDSVILFVGTLGVHRDVQGESDLGTITLNLTLESTGPPGPGNPVPEPSSLAALGLGLAALAWHRRRRG